MRKGGESIRKKTKDVLGARCTHYTDMLGPRCIHCSLEKKKEKDSPPRKTGQIGTQWHRAKMGTEKKTCRTGKENLKNEMLNKGHNAVLV